METTINEKFLELYVSGDEKHTIKFHWPKADDTSYHQSFGVSTPKSY